MGDEDDFVQRIGDAIANLTDHITHPDRPFTGQSHTDQGERGKTEVKNIRFRDLADCVCRAFVLSTPEVSDELRDRVKDRTLNYNDLFTLDISEMDPIALIQNITCEVEKAMGIFPNLP